MVQTLLVGHWVQGSLIRLVDLSLLVVLKVLVVPTLLVVQMGQRVRLVL